MISPGKNLLFLLFVTAISCTTSKSLQSIEEKSQNQSDSIPACIKEMIGRIEAEPVKNPPTQIFEYQYKQQRVFYVTAPCCDFFTELYDSSCTLIAHPDGGITGKGDGRAPDFIETRTGEKLIWVDKRKP